jgi:hypothetical protein
MDIELLKAKEAREPELLEIPGVVGVGVRNQRIVVYAEEAAPELLATVPASVEDIPVMVRVTGKIVALAMMPAVSPFSIQALAASRTDRWRPSPGGVSVSDPTCTAGTLGMWTKTKGGRAVLLTNSHVIAVNYATGGFNSPGTEVRQPGRYDGGTSADRIASLEKYTLEEGGYVDGAIAVPDSPDVVSPEILENGTPRGMVDPSAGMSVYKSGRTTGLTRTTVTDISATVKVLYPMGYITFRDQLIFENPGGSVISGGDSGSILLTDVAGVPMVAGLCFAGSSVVGVANKASRVAEALGLDFRVAAAPTPPEGFTWSAVVSTAVTAVPLSIIGYEEIRKYGERRGVIG